MQKNWYIIYTKPKTEKRVAKALTRKRIENYVPLNSRSIKESRKTKTEKVPLFPNYVFANISEAEASSILSLNNIINFVYWKQHPIVVPVEDLQMIKEFTINYSDITVQKIEVNINNLGKVFDGSQRFFSGNVLTIKNTVVKVNLPTIGFSMTAKVERENSLYPEIAHPEYSFHFQ